MFISGFPRIKALVNEDTLLPMMFLGLRKLGNICCGHKMFLNKIRLSSDAVLHMSRFGSCEVRRLNLTTTATATSLNKGLMSRTMAVHVRYNSLYISLPSSAKQQREMTNSALSEERELRRLIF